MKRRLHKSNLGLRFFLSALFALIPILHASAADGDDFEVDGIKYTVISEAEKTCRTKAGSAYTSGGIIRYLSGNTVSKSISLPSHPNGYTLIAIGQYGFSNNVELEELTIPSTVQSFGTTTFSGCSVLRKINIPEGVTKIAYHMFTNCRSLSNIVLPESIDEIGSYAFYSCTSLTTLIIPSSVKTFGEKVFYGCVFNPLVFKGEYTTPMSASIFDGMSKDNTILCTPNSLSSIKEAFKNRVDPPTITTNEIVYVCKYSPTFTGCNLTIVENPYITFENWSDYKIKFDKVSYNENEEKVTETFFVLSDVKPGEYNISGAPMGTNVEATISWKADSKEYSNNFSFTTKKADLISGINSTSAPTSITIDKINYNNDSTLYISEVGVYFNDKKYPFKDKIVIDDLKINNYYYQSFTPYLLYNNGKDEYKGNKISINTSTVKLNVRYSSTQTSLTISDLTLTPSEGINIVGKEVEYNYEKYTLPGEVTIKDLCPESSIYVRGIITYGTEGQYIYDSSESINTKTWYKSVSIGEKGPTSLELKASFNNNNTVEPAECWWMIGTEKYPGKNVDVTGLNPNAKYTPVFYWSYESPQNKKMTYNTNTYPKEVTLPALTLKTLAPKCVSSTCAIVAAETNIADVEPMVGFQWKKYDAPASLAPNEGFGAVCDGVVEGYIKNLQSSFYYNVRAFYKNAAGNYYFSDWVTFDPSDFSFFEPTVRTYPVQEVSQTSASVRGYALAGTENIKSQGFQYWVTSGPSSARMYAPANSEITTIVATGQIMTATFEDLLPGTSYTYRAFVETDAGFTFGDEQKFTTNESPSSYIETIVSEDSAPVIIGYFDLSGRRYSVMQPGMNIIVYSDGTTRKVMNR